MSHSLASKLDTVYLQLWRGKSDSILSKVLWYLCREFHQRKVLGITTEAFEKKLIWEKSCLWPFSLFPGHPYSWAVLIPVIHHLTTQQKSKEKGKAATEPQQHLLIAHHQSCISRAFMGHCQVKYLLIYQCLSGGQCHSGREALILSEVQSLNHEVVWVWKGPYRSYSSILCHGQGHPSLLVQADTIFLGTFTHIFVWVWPKERIKACTCIHTYIHVIYYILYISLLNP